MNLKHEPASEQGRSVAPRGVKLVVVLVFSFMALMAIILGRDATPP